MTEKQRGILQIALNCQPENLKLIPTSLYYKYTYTKIVNFIDNCGFPMKRVETYCKGDNKLIMSIEFLDFGSD